jgi:hypothetical protein
MSKPEQDKPQQTNMVSYENAVTWAETIPGVMSTDMWDATYGIEESWKL